MAHRQKCRPSLLAVEIRPEIGFGERVSRFGSIACSCCFDPTKKSLYDHNQPRLTNDAT